MDKKAVPGSCLIVSAEERDGLYPMYFGVSCAFLALRLLTEADKEDEKLSELRDKMLQGSAHLLGLLVWKIQREGPNWERSCELLSKLETAEKEVEELKKRRHEDARANEKVVGIFASQEQCWLNERKKLRQQIGALMNEWRVLEGRKDDEISELHEKLKEMEVLVQSKDKIMEEEEQKRKELEENLKKSENTAEELREKSKHEAEEHSKELWKLKTAFIELVSNQRQLEAEMGRALRQVEAKKQELDLVLGQKEESVLMAQKLSMEIVKLHKDLEQKDKILSAMLRKSKLDTAEKQMLLKEVKLSKVKRKQAELETEKWRVVSESRHERHSLRSMFVSQAKSKPNVPSGARGVSHAGKIRSLPADVDLEYKRSELNKDPEAPSRVCDRYPSEETEELGITADVKRLEGLIRLEAEKYATATEKRHHLELEAFAEQMRVKDEKLEAVRWRLLSMELESKRLQSHVEGLSQDLSRLRHDNMNLESLLMERQEELNSLKEQSVRNLSSRKTNSNSSLNDLALTPDNIWSKVKIVKKKSVGEQETKAALMEMPEDKETKKEEDNSSLLVQYPGKDLEKEAEVPVKCPIEEQTDNPVESDTLEKLGSPSQPLSKTTNPSWRMDLHALGVSYKIKRLKQQLLMFERLMGRQEKGEIVESKDSGIKDFLLLISLLNKQVNRYQSLQGKTDDLCKRMHDNDLVMSCEDVSVGRTKEDTKTLEHFLEETFQLQRYIVATGQKLMEIQSKIASGFIGVSEELDNSASFDIKRFGESIRTLFQEVQRGLEVRIARIIGDLEGTLACEGMVSFRT